LGKIQLIGHHPNPFSDSEGSDETRCQFTLNPEAMSALERRDLKIDMITNLEMDFTAATIDVYLLTGLSNAKIFANNLDLVLGILY
jgi:hypothetical protein